MGYLFGKSNSADSEEERRLKRQQAYYKRAFSFALERKRQERKREQEEKERQEQRKEQNDGGDENVNEKRKLERKLDQDEDAIVQEEMKHRKHEFQRVNRYFETNLLMHRLTATHFAARAKYCTYYPILGITMIVSIAAFVGTAFSTERSDDNDTAITLEEIEELFINAANANSSGNIDGRYLEDAELGVSHGFFSLIWERRISFFASLIAGICGVISTILASAGKYNNYQSKADMHISAVNTLNGICDTLKINEILLDRTKGNKNFVRLKNIRQDRIDRNIPLAGDDGTYGGIKLINSPVDGCDVEAHKMAFKTMKESCTFPIPTLIETAFRDLYWEFRPAPLQVRKYIYPRLYHALRQEIASYWAFPLFLPKIDIQTFCMKEMGEEYDEYFQKAEEDDENTTLRKENENLKKKLKAAEVEKEGTVAKEEEEGSNTSDEEDSKRNG